MIIELHNHHYQRNKQRYATEWFDLEKDEDEPNETFIQKEDLVRHVAENELNSLRDYPCAGDTTRVDLETWLDENQAEAIKHYLENKLVSI